MKKADRAFSLYIRERDGECLADPPHAGNLQCAHLITRSYKAIRTVPENAVALCQKHHLYFTHRPLEWREWVEDRFPGRWDKLKTAALTYERVDWKAEAEFYGAGLGIR
jgi:5-methylcytosine-specific restriction endonuclease McrA